MARRNRGRSQSVVSARCRAESCGLLRSSRLQLSPARRLGTSIRFYPSCLPGPAQNAVRGVAQAARLRACWTPTSTPEVPICAAGWMAMAVNLARCSAPGRVCSIADSRTVDGTHSTGYRDRFSMLCSRGRRPPCLLRLLRPGTSGIGGVPERWPRARYLRQPRMDCTPGVQWR
jgi:hypothetical protein